MSIEGMDVDQLSALAKQIDADAQALHNLVAGLTGVVGTLSLFWQGPLVATFEQDWHSKNRPALLAAYNTLTDLHTHLVNNINQQVSASAAEGGWAAAPGGVGAVVLGGIATAWDKLEKVEEVTSLPEYLISKEEELFGHDHPPTGKGPWGWLERHTGDPVFPELKDTKALRWLHNTPELRYADDLLVKTHAYKVLDKFIEPVSLAIAVASVGVDLGQASQAAVQGNDYAAAGHVADAEADGLGVIPVVGQLGAFDIEIAKATINEIVTGGPIPSPFSWQNLKEDYVPLPGEMWQELNADKGELIDWAFGGHSADG
jgi:uncharacterized protein YukE